MTKYIVHTFVFVTDIGIINDLNGDTFVQIFGLGKRYQASFGFVIDDTGSMGDEIEEVRKACIDIITNVFGTPNAPSNYILVTFNDPGSCNKIYEQLNSKNINT